ncbi:exonuclease subunit SbcD, partial [bacterium]|nr:exonuclease subunit SbcD [bacterium]
MKILHTSDWHLGAKLYERSRESEHAAFLDWLLDTIVAKHVDALLVVGDVFDTAMPAAQTETLYYQFLLRLFQETDVTAVISAGNHDSAKRLSAPREFLKMARIHIVGLMPDNPADVLIPIEKNGEKVWIGAMPYLSEGELLAHISFEKKVESARRYREAVKQLNHSVADAVPDVAPLI